MSLSFRKTGVIQFIQFSIYMQVKKDGKEDEAEALAEQSELDLRLAIAKSENEVAKNEDKKLEEALRADEERKVLYQSILNKETNK